MERTNDAGARVTGSRKASLSYWHTISAKKERNALCLELGRRVCDALLQLPPADEIPPHSPSHRRWKERMGCV